jgi:hypothetical protein
VTRIETNVVMVSIHAKECGLRAKSLRDFESEDVVIESDRPVQIGHLKVNMSDTYA